MKMRFAAHTFKRAGAGRYAGRHKVGLARFPIASQLQRQHLACQIKCSAENRSWDAGRFFQTVLFFNNPLQMVSDVASVVSSPFRGTDSLEAEDRPYDVLVGAPASSDTPAILVTGATGALGTKVVTLLLSKGLRVRALVRDAEKARTLFSKLDVGSGSVLEIAVGDVTQPNTLRPESFAGVRSVVSCCGCVVRPKEASDEEDRLQKYRQGIKFYDSKLERDTPDAVERDGLETVIERVKDQVGTWKGVTLLSASSGSSTVEWAPLDDVVMGGVSQSGLFKLPRSGPHGEDTMVFRGVVSTSNNGGFASVRPRNWQPPLDLSPYEGLRVTLKGDGQRYKLILRCSGDWDSISYCLSFDTAAGEWQTLDLPFKDFQPVFRARTDPSAPPFDPSQLYSLQIMLSKFEYDGDLNPSFSPGAFELPISSITTYFGASVTPRFVLVSSAGVTRMNRPGIDLSVEPKIIQLNDVLGGLLTFKLAGEDILRGSGIPFTVVRSCAMTEEPAGMPVEIEQGDTIQGKIGRADLASLCVSLLDSPAAVDTTFEVKSCIDNLTPWTEEDAQAAPPRDWDSVINGANLAQGVTGKTIDGVYTGKQPEAAFKSASQSTVQV